jgi:hypothetical protein
MKEMVKAGLGERIGRVADLLGKRTAAAEHLGISTDTLQRWIRVENAPSFESIAALCWHTGVWLEWMATGEGKMFLGREGADRVEGDSSANIAIDVVIESIRLLRFAFKHEGLNFDPEADRVLLSETAERLAANGGRLSVDEIAALCKRAALGATVVAPARAIAQSGAD